MNLRPYLQFNRKISSRLTALLARTPVTPNAVTTLALLAGIGCGLCMTRGTLGWMLAGTALLHLSFILDNCDGELARLRGHENDFGRRYDMIADLGVDVALWSGLAAGASLRGGEIWSLVGLLACLGSLVNFVVVIHERRAGVSTSVHRRAEPAPEVKHSLFHSLIDTLCHNGDSIALAWLGALTGDPAVFLIGGSVYIHGIWIARAWAYFKRSRQAILHAVFLGLGIYLLSLSLREVSWPMLADLIRKSGFGIFASFAVFPVVCLFHALGLYYLIAPARRARIGLFGFYLGYLTGDSLNKITPFIDVAGEPMKATLLTRRGWLPQSQAVASLWNARIYFVLSEVVHLVVALAALALFFPSRRFFAVGLCGILLSLVCAAALQVMKRKVFDKWEILPEPVPASSRIASFFWNSIGWFALTFEVYIVLRFMEVPIGLGQAFLIQALLQAAQTVSFFIPANLGAQEGALAHLLKHFGFSATEGIALSLLKRARQFFWALVGSALFSVLNRRPAETAGPASEAAPALEVERT